MQGYLSIILHAHLPFVRHPEHDRFLEESWLFEAVTETYLPILQILESWQIDQIDAKITLSLSPTLCAMHACLRDPFAAFTTRYERLHLNGLIDLADKEIHRTHHWDRAYRELAWMYHHKFSRAREAWRRYDGNLIAGFKKLQELGRLEIITTAAATTWLLPAVDVRSFRQRRSARRS